MENLNSSDQLNEQCAEAHPLRSTHYAQAHWSASTTKLPQEFERREIAVPFNDVSVVVPMHIHSASGCYPDALGLLVNGVDTWKMVFHPLYVGMAQRLGMTVMAFVSSEMILASITSHPRMRSPLRRSSGRNLLDRSTNAPMLVMEVLLYIASWLPRRMRA